ncbi:hypothetical protein TcG_08459 [Trypanosoma cruzi]|nr:hypothetical protein TcG_08459 [Trypanosoma cruzi]
MSLFFYYCFPRPVSWYFILLTAIKRFFIQVNRQGGALSLTGFFPLAALLMLRAISGLVVSAAVGIGLYNIYSTQNEKLVQDELSLLEKHEKMAANGKVRGFE